ncbi:hypothetical protein XF_1268 [Xylella fastidiosa 9a5c]|uniref:Uncharacterized protein n=1 Tax=Xylella fastidiosa (strain 9a5c) TaxID=160492 RepID=Q9PDW1_XYLFA|nr:hypothetical protein XF_1268 [Xylella fastidiosa 9a5c]
MLFPRNIRFNLDLFQYQKTVNHNKFRVAEYSYVACADEFKKSS